MEANELISGPGAPVNTYVFAGNLQVFHRWVRKQVDAGAFEIIVKWGDTAYQRKDGSWVRYITSSQKLHGRPKGQFVKLWGWGVKPELNWSRVDFFAQHLATEVIWDIE